MVILELIHAEKAPHGVVFIRLKTNAGGQLSGYIDES